MRRELPPCFALKAGQCHEQAWGSELTGPGLSPHSSLTSWAALDKSFPPLSLHCEVGGQHLPLRVPGRTY